MDNPPRFDKLWYDLLKNQNAMCSHAANIQEHTRLFRRYAYRFAQAVIAVREHHHNELIEMLAGMKKSIDAWLNDGFGVIEQMGDRRKDLMEAIGMGMTEEEYIQHGNVWLIRKHINKRKKNLSRKTEQIVQAPLSANISDVERLKILEDHNALLLADLKDTKKAIRQSEQDLAKLAREVARMKKQIDRADKIISTIKRQAG